MKTLQNNFTTPEQSKRLLELGVPADSADCFYDKQFYGGNIVQTRMYAEWRTRHDLFSGVLSDILTPCWSVGRLIEICKVCEPKKDYELLCDELKNCKNYCVLIISHIIANLPIIDFSKLEE